MVIYTYRPTYIRKHTIGLHIIGNTGVKCALFQHCITTPRVILRPLSPLCFPILKIRGWERAHGESKPIL